MEENSKPKKKEFVLQALLRVLFGHEMPEQETPPQQPAPENNFPKRTDVTVPAAITGPTAPPKPEKQESNEMMVWLGLKEKRSPGERIGSSGYKMLEEETAEEEAVKAFPARIASKHRMREKPQRMPAQKKPKGMKAGAWKKELEKRKTAWKAKLARERKRDSAPRKSLGKNAVIAQAKKKAEKVLGELERSQQTKAPKMETRQPEKAETQRAIGNALEGFSGPLAARPKPTAPKAVAFAGENEIPKMIEKPKIAPAPRAEMQPVDKAIAQLDEQSFYTREMMKNLEKEFYRQHITEKELRERMLDYRQQLHLQELRKKKLEEAKAKGVTEVAKESAVPGVTAGSVVGKTDWRQMIESKATGKVNEEKLSELESKMAELVEKNHISKKELEKDIASLDENKLLADFDKLINLMELEHQAKKMHEEPKQKVETIEPNRKEKAEAVKAIAIELQKHRIITEFDKIIDLVKQSGRMSQREIAKRLGMKKSNVSQWCQILEDGGMVTIDYPPLGDPVVFDKNYIAPAKGKRGGK